MAIVGHDGKDQRTVFPLGTLEAGQRSGVEGCGRESGNQGRPQCQSLWAVAVAHG